MNKEQIRNLIKKKRITQDKDKRNFKSKAIMDNMFLLPELASQNIRGKNIALFKSFGGEPKMEEIFKKIIDYGGNCFFPVIEDGKLYMQKVLKEDIFQKGGLGILEPALTKTTFIPMDIILIPGIAFSEKGDRIGFGKGYYDMYLKDYPFNGKPLLIAPIYEFQIVPDTLSEAHDVPVDILVTEKRIIKTNARNI